MGISGACGHNPGSIITTNGYLLIARARARTAFCRVRPRMRVIRPRSLTRTARVKRGSARPDQASLSVPPSRQPAPAEMLQSSLLATLLVASSLFARGGELCAQRCGGYVRKEQGWCLFRVLALLYLVCKTYCGPTLHLLSGRARVLLEFRFPRSLTGAITGFL